ncbi:MAG TPA: hypothetical protein VM142_07645 [Acidimicrobiales bacterium]|nr:hypothetical protein [Acidimicrobiales bacterium]
MDVLPDFFVSAATDEVDAWSTRRLPFEPRGSMLEFRAALRAALTGLRTSRGSLRSEYLSQSEDFCDAENVLLYNVGMASFSRLATASLTFERGRTAPPPCPRQLSAQPLHYHRYETSHEESFRHWHVDGIVASGDATIARRGLDKAAHWWWTARSGAREIAGSLAAGEPFGLRVTVAGASRPLVSMLKPMLDGVIASLHNARSSSDETVKRLGDALRVDPDALRQGLEAGPSLLGERDVVRSYRSGVQWNPADDLCVACTIEVSGEGDNPELHWELLRVSALGSTAR